MQITEWVNRQPADFMVQWAGLTYTYSLTVDQMIHHYHRGLNSLDADVFVYKILESDRFVGTIQLSRFNKIAKEAVIGRFLIGDESDRGKGLGKRVLGEIIKIGFHDFGLLSLRLNVFDINDQAIKCYESVGFKRGLLTEKVYQDQGGHWWNNVEMTIKKGDETFT